MEIEIEKFNAVYMRVFADAAITNELYEYFTFKVEGCQFMPAYKSGRWDGKIRLYNKLSCTLFVGLLPYVRLFAQNSNYTIKYLSEIVDSSIVDEDVINSFIEDLNVYSNNIKLDIRDYQFNAIVYAINNKRCIIESPTGSGKSLLIYALMRWYIKHNHKCLIIVPTIQLVEQLFTDFKDYSSHNGWDVDKNVGQIYSGKEKSNEKNCMISTYQSLIKLPNNWFLSFGACITDEAHTADTKSISGIMTNMTNAVYRVGTSGTLKESKTSLLTLEGLYGTIYKPVTTKKLMDNNTLATLSIKAMLLEYNKEDAKEVSIITKIPNTKKYDYSKEIKWLISNPNRNNFIANLSVYTKGNTLVLFQFVENHGVILFNMINEILKSKNSDRKTFFIHGEIDIKDREIMRKTLTTDNNVIVVASYQTLSTGINAPSIQNIILSSPTKSKIRLLQSIGRSLRINNDKTTATIYDIGDNLKYKNHTNFSLLHFIERLKLYNSEEFDYKLLNIKMK